MTDDEFFELLTLHDNIAFDCGAFEFDNTNTGTPKDSSQYEKLLARYNETKNQIIEAWKNK